MIKPRAYQHETLDDQANPTTCNPLRTLPDAESAWLEHLFPISIHEFARMAGALRLSTYHRQGRRHVIGDTSSLITHCDIVMNALSSVRRASYLNCSDKTVGALLRLFALGMASVPSEDLDDLLLALRVLKPSSTHVDFSEANLRVRQSDWIGALRVLKSIEARHQGGAACAALIACCLYHLRDTEWRRYVELVLEDGNPVALSVVATFLRLNMRPGGNTSGVDSDAHEHMRAQIEHAVACAR
ncbi:HrpB1 family type III secretion system apparatus protein [Mycetohabitans endofungorum]|uniref:HrpB1 family type III secretion system apparatus protein n=3 Tax=Burkholderiales TaxID=80840 RepID=UPI002B0594EE|nr:HrpB1 family type III secretion system apparatus protein [Mycetohabitans endofungorum]